MDTSDLVDFSPAADWAEPAYWMSSAVARGAGESERDRIIEDLARRGVETRPFFYPLHTLPPYATQDGQTYPVATRLAASGLNLPSSASLTVDDVEYVCEALEAAVASAVLSA
jgi:perosamine synthetase